MKIKKSLLKELNSMPGLEPIDRTAIVRQVRQLYNGEKCAVVFTGNKKIDNTVCVSSIPPVYTCRNCDTCAGTCYALKAYLQYRTARRAWIANYLFSKYYTQTFIDNTIAGIAKKKKTACRIHSSGDFYSVDYINAWAEIASGLPGVRFWTYSKQYTDKETGDAIEDLAELPNINIVDSMPLGRRNYGSMEYIQGLKKDLESYGNKAYICPCGTDNTIKCGRDCTACGDYEYVLFLQH